MQRFFISATGTDAGKTFATTALITQLRDAGKTVKALKPIASGVDPQDTQSDPALLAHALGQGDASSICLYALRTPTAPDIAAAQEGITLEWARTVQFCDAPAASDYLLIEGAGGLFSPLTAHQTNADLAHALQLPVILVAPCHLGGVSQLLATLIAATARGITIAGIIINASTQPHALTPQQMQDALTRLAPAPLPPITLLPRIAAHTPRPDLRLMLGSAALAG